MLLSQRPLWQRLAIAPVAVLAALAIRLVLTPLTGHEGPFLVFFSAVMLSAWIGGNLGGILATILTVPLAAIFFLNSGTFTWEGIAGSTILIELFVLDALVVSAITNRLWRTAEQAARQRAELVSLIDGVHDYAIFLLSATGAVVSWNTGAERITGYRAKEVLGQPLSLFYPVEERAAGRPEAAILAAVAGHYQGEGWHQRKDGTRFWANVVITPLTDTAGQVTGFAKVVRDVTELRQRAEALEARVVERTAELTAANTELQVIEMRLRVSLHEKEVLIKEIHHRVKNNLQVVMSLLRLQARQLSDPRAIAALRDSRQRVEVMALVHELLYRTGDMASIDATTYSRQLSSQMLRLYDAAPDQVTLELAAEGVWLSLDQAVPCGLIIHELVSNSLKYAFPDGRPGTVGIALHATSPDMLTLTVWDTGVGMPTNVPASAQPSMGTSLVHDLVRQLRGTIVITSDAGVTVTITFPQTLAAAPPSP